MRRAGWTIALVCLLAAAAQAPTSSARPRTALSFEANRGQTDSRVRFVVRGGGATAWIADDAAVFALPARDATDVLRLRFLDAARSPLVGVDSLPTRSRYLRGGAAPIDDVPHFAAATSNDIWPRIDLRWHADRGALEYDLVLHPGAEVASARVAVDGADSLRLGEDGSLVAQVGAREFVQATPVAWQTRDGVREPVVAAFDLRGNEIGFRLGDHDAARDVVIDPTILWSTFLGGSGSELGDRVAVDPNDGSIVVCGATNSLDYPLSYGHLPTAPKGGWDAFVAAIDATGDRLLFSTFLGGAGDDFAKGIAVEAGGAHVYVAGYTASVSDFPLVAPTQATYGGGPNDAFLATFAPAGPGFVLARSSFLGGHGDDRAYDVALAPGGAEPYVTGYTTSADFPNRNILNISGTTFQSRIGGSSDAFVARFATGASPMIWSTFVGGAAEDWANGVAVAANGDVAIVGQTDSFDLPRVSAAQSSRRGPDDAFVAKIRASGDVAEFVTYLGGGGSDRANSVALDSSSGDAFVVGTTESANFPATGDAYQSTLAGGLGADAFVPRFGTTNGIGGPVSGTLKFATYFGGSGVEAGNGVALVAPLQAVVVGTTKSADFPRALPMQAARFGDSDAFVARLNLTGGLFPAADFVAQGRTPDTVALSWTDNVDDETGFVIDRTAPDGSTTTITTGPNVTQYVDSGLAPDTPYTYEITAVAADGSRSKSNVAVGATLPFAPAAPTRLSASANGSRVTLDWADASADEDTFVVQRSTGGAFVPVATLPADATHFETIVIVATATDTTWRVTATNRGGDSSPSNQAIARVSPTLSVTATSGSAVDATRAGADRFTAKARFAGATFDRFSQAARLEVGPAADPLVVEIPAGDRGWKSKRGVLTWDSVRALVAGPHVVFALDAAKGTFSVNVSKLDWTSPPANPIRVGLALGNAAGAAESAWRADGNGKLVLR